MSSKMKKANLKSFSLEVECPCGETHTFTEESGNHFVCHCNYSCECCGESYSAEYDYKCPTNNKYYEVILGY